MRAGKLRGRRTAVYRKDSSGRMERKRSGEEEGEYMGHEKANGMDGNMCGWSKLEKRGLEKEGLNEFHITCEKKCEN